MPFPISATLLDFCVLVIVSEQDEYGYSITQRIQSVIQVSESTLYPVLRRLQQARFLMTYDQAFQGRNRRYYRITAEGRAQLQLFYSDWEQHKAIVDSLVKRKISSQHMEGQNEQK